jgi:hypothetical protein
LKNGEKPNLKQKKDLGSSFKKVFARKPKSELEDFTYQQSYWKYLCNWESKKFQQVLKDNKRDLYFGNSIMTDGCSISFNLMNNPGKKGFKGRTRKKKSNKDEFLQDLEFSSIKILIFLLCVH